MPPTEREAVSHCVTSPWHSATGKGMDQSEINPASCLTALLRPPKKLHSHPHFEVVIELHFPFDEQLNASLVALVILSSVKAKPCLKDSKRYRRIYCYNCPENTIMVFISAISHIHVTYFLKLIFIQIQIWAFRK